MSRYSFIDPTLEQDLASSSKPWALSPLIATMPYLEHTRISGPGDIPPFPAEDKLIGNDVSQLHLECAKKTDLSKDRRTVFKNVARRKEVVFRPEVRTYSTQLIPFCLPRAICAGSDHRGLLLQLPAFQPARRGAATPGWHRDRHDEVLGWPTRTVRMLREAAARRAFW